MEKVFDDISLIDDIDTSTGVNLDSIGEIVGISRVLPNSIALEFFGFSDSAPIGIRFGEEGDAGIGARFREENEPATASSTLNDIEYRQLIRAKIIKNHSQGTGEDMLRGLQFIFNDDRIILEDNYDMSYDISVGRPITLAENALLDLDILPRPAGVKINILQTYVPTNFFGFSDQVGAKGFDIGLFAEEI